MLTRSLDHKSIQEVRDVLLLTKAITTVSKSRNVPCVTLSPFQGECPHSKSILCLLLPRNKIPSCLWVSRNISHNPLVPYHLGHQPSYCVSLSKPILTEVLVHE